MSIPNKKTINDSHIILDFDPKLIQISSILVSIVIQCNSFKQKIQNQLNIEQNIHFKFKINIHEQFNPSKRKEKKRKKEKRFFLAWVRIF